MFRISVIESQDERRLVLEGRLMSPWIGELENAWRQAGEQLEGRKLIIDLTNVTLISRDAENILFRLMKQGARFTCEGVFTKHVIKEIARRCRCGTEHAKC